MHLSKLMRSVLLQHSPGASWSVCPSVTATSPDALHTLHEYLSPNLVFIATPPGTAIPLNSKLPSIRHQPLSKLSDLRAIRLTHKRLWMRISNMASSRRKLQQDSLRVLRIFEHWLLYMCPFCVMRPPAPMVMEVAADAPAAGQSCSLGGFIRHPQLGQLWFIETFSHLDFQNLGIAVHRQMQRELSCYEALAQGARILAASSLLPCCSLCITLKTVSDNTGAEAGCKKFFTTSRPQAFFLERLALLSAHQRVTLDVSHIPGEMNVKSDALSRPLEKDHPEDCLLHERVRFSLESLWSPRSNVRFPG